MASTGVPLACLILVNRSSSTAATRRPSTSKAALASACMALTPRVSTSRSVASLECAEMSSRLGQRSRVDRDFHDDGPRDRQPQAPSEKVGYRRAEADPGKSQWDRNRHLTKLCFLRYGQLPQQVPQGGAAAANSHDTGRRMGQEPSHRPDDIPEYYETDRMAAP